MWLVGLAEIWMSRPSTAAIDENGHQHLDAPLGQSPGKLCFTLNACRKPNQLFWSLVGIRERDNVRRRDNLRLQQQAFSGYSFQNRPADLEDPVERRFRNQRRVLVIPKPFHA